MHVRADNDLHPRGHMCVESASAHAGTVLRGVFAPMHDDLLGCVNPGCCGLRAICMEKAARLQYVYYKLDTVNIQFKEFNNLNIIYFIKTFPAYNVNFLLIQFA